MVDGEQVSVGSNVPNNMCVNRCSGWIAFIRLYTKIRRPRAVCNVSKINYCSIS